MTERYAVAAWRHQRAACALVYAGEIDDAAYHYGIAGENAIKFGLREAGLEEHWHVIGAAQGLSPTDALKGTPMRGHLPDLKKLVRKARAEIALYASGRVGGAVQDIMLDVAFAHLFTGWHIDIRYARSDLTPVSHLSCDNWADDATKHLLELVI